MDSAAALSYAVRPAVLGYYLSRLSLALAALTLVPLLGAALLDELRLATNLAVVVGLLAVVWLPGRRMATPTQLQENEALVIVTLTFLLASLVMLLPYSGEGLPLEDALFESISAVTTTGLSTVSPAFSYSPGLKLTRAWMQWYGGLGIAVFSIALVLRMQSGARRLAGLDTPENLPASARHYSRRVLVVYLILTAFVIAALWLALDDGFQALLHALTAVSTGGFSGYENSLADMPSVAAPFITIGASLLGAMPLLLYFHLASQRRLALTGNPEWWALPVMVVVVAVGLMLILHHIDGMSWRQAAYHGSLLGGSAQTTAGFSTLDVGGVSDAAKLIMILAMLVGGSVGSTAGGIKVLRLLVLTRVVGFVIRRTSMSSHAVTDLRLGGRSLAPEDVQRALVVTVLFLLTVVLSWLVMAAGGEPVFDALFDVVSATGTVGLSAGVAGPDLPAPLKLVLCLDMLAGRLEILALLVVLYPRTWLGRRIESR